MHHPNHEELLAAADALHVRVCEHQRQLFAAIAHIDRSGAWRDEGARDVHHWLWMRYGISDWKARRWVAAAYALESLPRVAQAFSTGVLGVDKVVELTRFATPADEAELVEWATGVASGRIRQRGDAEARRSAEQQRELERSRACSWWYADEGRRFGLEAELPAAQGAVVAAAIERMTRTVPVMPGEEDPLDIEARRADALVAICSAGLADSPDPDRATVVVHVPLEALSRDANAEIEGGGVIAADTARRLMCDARIQAVVETASGEALGLGRLSREPSAAMLRQLRYRDRGCRFPGCGSRAFTHAHHVRWWRQGGRTDLDNLVLVCSYHHRLVHEHRWRLERDPSGTLRWFRPGGRPYRAGPRAGPAPQRATEIRIDQEQAVFAGA